MKYRYILDNVLTLVDDTEAQGFDKFSSEIKRDDNLHGITNSFDATLTFTGVGYDYINDKFNNEGYCNEITIQVQELHNNAWLTIHNGIIKLSDIEIIEEKEIRVKITDNNYDARIKNNLNIEGYPFAGKSKNGVNIDSAELYRITMFRPSDGLLYTPQDTYGLTGYRIFELFKYLINYMSDGEIDFASDTFGVGGKYEGLALMQGYVIFFGKSATFVKADFEDNSAKLSFKKLIDELYKITNLAFKIETGGAKPVLRIETADVFFAEENPDVVFSDIENIKTKVDSKKLYSLLSLGGDYITESEVDPSTMTVSFASSADFVGFKREKFPLAGQCNSEAEFDLQAESFIRDSNIIEDVIVNSNPNYQDRWFLIETDYVSNVAGNAVLGDPFATGVAPYSYNPSLINSEIANNFLGFIPNSVVSYLGQQTGGLFQASKTLTLTMEALLSGAPSLPQTLNPWYFPEIIAENDSTGGNFDDGANYDPVTGEYTISNPGKYTFTAKSNVQALSASIVYFIGIGRYSGGTLLQGPVTSFFGGLAGIPLTPTICETSQTFICNAGDVIKFHHAARKFGNFNGTPFQLKYLKRSTIACTFVQTGGGIYLGADPTAYKTLLHDFEYDLSLAQQKSIINNPEKQYTFYKAGQTPRKGWIDRIRMDRNTGNSLVTLISAPDTNA